jgi:hypothetical protein
MVSSRPGNRAAHKWDDGKRRSNSFRTLARAATNARLQASEIRVGSGWANQFGSCPKLPTWTKRTPLSLAHSLRVRSGAMILLSSSEPGRAIRGGSLNLRRLGMVDNFSDHTALSSLSKNVRSGDLVPSKCDRLPAGFWRPPSTNRSKQ